MPQPTHDQTTQMLLIDPAASNGLISSNKPTGSNDPTASDEPAILNDPTSSNDPTGSIDPHWLISFYLPKWPNHLKDLTALHEKSGSIFVLLSLAPRLSRIFRAIGNEKTAR